MVWQVAVAKLGPPYSAWIGELEAFRPLHLPVERRVAVVAVTV